MGLNDDKGLCDWKKIFCGNLVPNQAQDKKSLFG
jgi:hypothetical protein